MSLLWSRIPFFFFSLLRLLRFIGSRVFNGETNESRLFATNNAVTMRNERQENDHENLYDTQGPRSTELSLVFPLISSEKYATIQKVSISTMKERKKEKIKVFDAGGTGFVGKRIKERATRWMFESKNKRKMEAVRGNEYLWYRAPWAFESAQSDSV